MNSSNGNCIKTLKLLTLYSQWNFANGRIKKKYSANGERENGPILKQLPGEVLRAIPAQGDFISEGSRSSHHDKG